jgi:hypothetical protein
MGSRREIVLQEGASFAGATFSVALWASQALSCSQQ